MSSLVLPSDLNIVSLREGYILHRQGTIFGFNYYIANFIILQPLILLIQMMRIGQLIILIVPGGSSVACLLSLFVLILNA